jgi:hypothetical protein
MAGHHAVLRHQQQYIQQQQQQAAGKQQQYMVYKCSIKTRSVYIQDNEHTYSRRSISKDMAREPSITLLYTKCRCVIATVDTERYKQT